MRIHVLRSVAVLLFVAIPGMAVAADPAWSGEGELGLAATSGNSDNQTLNASLALERQSLRWEHGAAASFLFGRSDGEETAYRYEVALDSRFALDERQRLFGALRHERDHFATNEYQWTLAGGYGRQLVDSERGELRVELGPGYRWSKLQGVQVRDNGAIVRALAEGRRELNEQVEVTGALLVEAGNDNTFVRQDLGLQVRMSEALALKAGLEVRHNTRAAADRERTDTLTTLNLVYGF